MVRKFQLEASGYRPVVVVSKEKSVADGVAVVLVAEGIVEPGVIVLQY